MVVAENYKSNLQNWPNLNDGDSKGFQELVRFQEVMKALKLMVELDSSQTLATLSAKLPSYSGINWCRFVNEEQARCQNSIGFKEIIQFVTHETEVANDPVLSPDALKRERSKDTDTNEQPVHVTRPKRWSETSTGQAFFSSVTKPGETSRTVAPPPQVTPCPVCEGNHSAVKCHKIVNTLPLPRWETQHLVQRFMF